ncbi:MAG: hypothetical protein EBU31_00475 [Proteobacteria bacterium]|nr:hypothetical protein [Pseudomonadota bacterium]
MSAVQIISPVVVTESMLTASSIGESETWNRLLFENDLTNAVWTKTGAAATANTAVGPLDGKTTADTLTANAANGQAAQSYTAIAASYTFSVYLKRRTGTGAISLSLDGTTFTTVTITATWAKYTVSDTLTAGAKSAVIQLATSGDAIDVWGAVVVTAFAIGDRVERLTTHAVYQRKVAGTTDTMPEYDLVNWTRVSPNNRWALLDSSAATQSTASTTITYTFRPGAQNSISAVGAFNVSGASITVDLLNQAGSVMWTSTRGLGGAISTPDWYAYFFEERNVTEQLVVIDLPAVSDPNIRLTVTPASGVAAIGTFMFGSGRGYGYGAELGAAFSIRDFSIKTTDEFGTAVFVQRAFAKKARFQMYVDAAEADRLFFALSQRRAKPTLYIVTDRFEAGYIFGFYNDFQMVVPYPEHTVYELELESLA